MLLQFLLIAHWFCFAQPPVSFVMSLGRHVGIDAGDISRDGSLLGIGAGDNGPGSISVLDLRKNKVLFALGRFPIGIRCVAFSPDSGYLAGGGRDGVVRLVDVRTKKEVKQFHEHPRDKIVDSIAFSPDGTILSSVSYTSIVCRYLEENKVVVLNNKSLVMGISFAPNGKHLAAAGHDGTVSVWALGKQPKALTVLRGHGDTVNCVAWSPDSGTIASAGEGGQVILWNARTWKESKRLKAIDNVFSISFAPNNKLLVIGGIDQVETAETKGVVKVFGLKKDRVDIVARFVAHNDPVLFVSFVGPECERLVTMGGEDGLLGEVKLWKLRSPIK